MSAHADHDAEHAEGEHDDHDDGHHAAPPLDEPATPLWLTLLGIGLFLVAAIAFVATREDGKTTAELTAEPSTEAVAAASAPPAPNAAAPNAPAPNAPNPAQPLQPPGAPGAQPAIRQLPPGMQMGAPPNPARPPGGAPAPAGAAQPPVKRSQQPGHEGHNHD